MLITRYGAGKAEARHRARELPQGIETFFGAAKHDQKPGFKKPDLFVYLHDFVCS